MTDQLDVYIIYIVISSVVLFIVGTIIVDEIGKRRK